MDSTSTTFNEMVATPGFSLSADPNSLTIARGSTGTATITFTPVGNYQGTVTLACNNLPQYTSCAFKPSSLTLTGMQCRSLR